MMFFCNIYKDIYIYNIFRAKLIYSLGFLFYQEKKLYSLGLNEI